MNRYTDEKIARMRVLAADPKRHLLWGVPAVVALIAFIPNVPDGIHVLGGIAFFCGVIGVVVQRAPAAGLRHYDALLAQWQLLVAKSDPRTAIAVGFRLRAGEVACYSERGQRCEERKTGQVINTQSRTKNAVGGAVIGGLLFGSAGAIVGGGMARRQTTGTATDIYDVVPVDEGDIVVTNQRFLFMGTRNTVDVPLNNIMRFSTAPGSARIIPEYAGRVPGESYVVSPLLFAMCMARRARQPGFVVPQPPAPLPLRYSVAGASPRLSLP